MTSSDGWRTVAESPACPPSHSLWVEGWRPVRTNVYMRMHWGKRKKTRQHIADVLRVYKYLHGVPDAHGKRRVSLYIVLGKGQKKADPDAYWKCLLDSMQDACLIKDDSYEWVELAPIHYGVDWSYPGTRIDLWDL